MPPSRLLRIASLYHGFVGVVLMVLPGDLMRFLGIDPPSTWLWYYLSAVAPLVAGLLLEGARRKPDLMPGIVSSVIAGNLAALTIGVFFIVLVDLPLVLLGPAVAAGLWAWLLGGLYSGDGAADE